MEELNQNELLTIYGGLSDREAFNLGRSWGRKVRTIIDDLLLLRAFM